MAMSELAIKVDHLSKKYQIGKRQVAYLTIRDALVSGARSFYASVFKGRAQERRDEIWALSDVSFEINQGEVLGIIGRNGAGKSTLLKILAHITNPTKGQVEIHGRVGSLLEVGTGFSNELSGRENIYLNGAILGMKKAEIDRKFDEIVAFAEIEKFLDTPAKHYSTGMFMRLAFAVAAHLEPEILLIDEVLAVGDAVFQKKCLGKMGEVAHQGRTILFVSHNMAAVSNLCPKSILINRGSVIAFGPTNKVIDLYSENLDNLIGKESPGVFDLNEHQNKYLENVRIIKRVVLMNSERQPQAAFRMGQELTIGVDVEGLSDYTDSIIGIIFKTKDDQWIAGINTEMSVPSVEVPRHKNETAELTITSLPFTPGIYYIGISVTRKHFGRIDYVDQAAKIIILESDVYNSGFLVSSEYGLIYLKAAWQINKRAN